MAFPNSKNVCHTTRPNANPGHNTNPDLKLNLNPNPTAYPNSNPDCNTNPTFGKTPSEVGWYTFLNLGRSFGVLPPHHDIDRTGVDPVCDASALVVYCRGQC